MPEVNQDGSCSTDRANTQAPKHLKRGDACLACRRRRIRCDGDKPKCATCARLRKECVYETIKPVSRISKLKERIAELESTIGDIVDITPVSSSSEPMTTLVTPVTSESSAMSSTSHQIWSSSSRFSSSSRNFPPVPSNAWTTTSLPRPPQEPQRNFQFDFSVMDEPMSHLTSVLDLTDLIPGHEDNNEHSSLIPAPSGFQSHQNQTPLNYDILGNCHEPSNIPPPLRDHLLDLFFSHHGNCNAEYEGSFSWIFDIPRFYTRMTLPLSKRPHPALLNAMYLLASAKSTQPAVQQLSSKFLEATVRTVQEGLKAQDRIMDVLRATTILTLHYFSTEQYLAGYGCAGSAIRLATSCGLHRIGSSVWQPQPKHNAILMFTLREGGFMGPPEDQMELAERIYAFWDIYEIDLCTAIGYMFDTGFNLDEIETPLPLPLDHHRLGLINADDGIRVQDSILDPDISAKYTPKSSFWILRIKALTLLAHCSRLCRAKPEKGALTLNRTQHVIPYSVAVCLSHPEGFRTLRQALNTFVSHLPPHCYVPWETWDEGDIMRLPEDQAIHVQGAVLQTLMGACYLQLWNVRSMRDENVKAVLVARRLVGFIGRFGAATLTAGYGLFIVTIWNDVAMILLREVKRLQLIGNTMYAAIIEVELDIVTNTIKQWAGVSITGQHERLDIAAVNTKMLNTLRALPLDKWVEAFEESSRRYG